MCAIAAGSRNNNSKEKSLVPDVLLKKENNNALFVCVCFVCGCTQIREKTQYPSPWRQRIKTSPDGEVTQIMSRTDPDGLKVTKTRVTRDLRSPRNISSPRNVSSPGKRL